MRSLWVIISAPWYKCDAMSSKPKLEIRLCAPRGFCAGVDRAIQIVEEALIRFGAPVYVRHEIVHNRYVVEGLKAKGAVFVDELEEIPDTAQPVIFSAHGVPKHVPESARARNLTILDATCPLVSKVHKEAVLHHRRGRHIVLVGHAGHPEVEGTMGQLADGAATLIETVADAESFQPRDPERLAWITQTTLSVDDTADIIAVLTQRFPAILGPHKDDICYATTNRQEAVKAVAPRVDRMIVVGAPNSSNSNRLAEVGRNQGCEKSILIERAADLDMAWLDGVQNLGLTAGASAPEILVQELIAACEENFAVTVENVNVTDEDVEFSLPRALTA